MRSRPNPDATPCTSRGAVRRVSSWASMSNHCNSIQAWSSRRRSTTRCTVASLPASSGGKTNRLLMFVNSASHVHILR